MIVRHDDSGISAECIAASVYDGGPPIYTVVTRAPKYLDAEFEKHRMLSSNSSSSRAIPVEQIIEQVRKDPWVPRDWRAAQKGMQGYQKPDRCQQEGANDHWLAARLDAIATARVLVDHGIHKQHINRILEPWMWQWKVVTATEWDNFFNLRCHPAADPAMQALANCIREAVETAKLVDRDDGSWHLPFVLDEERNPEKSWTNYDLLKVSAARCARISYATHGTDKPDWDKDLRLAYRLESDGHLTPFEHQARKLSAIDQGCYSRDGDRWSANFRGWHQFRKEIE